MGNLNSHKQSQKKIEAIRNLSSLWLWFSFDNSDYLQLQLFHWWNQPWDTEISALYLVKNMQWKLS